MDDRGLHASIWATPRPGAGNNSSFSRSGDWTCSSCGFSNFQWRTDCFRCNRSRAGTPPNAVPANLPPNGNLGHAPPSLIGQSIIGDSVRQDGGSSSMGTRGNSSHAQASLGVNAPSIKGDTTRHGPMVNGNAGLATSRWAPRNYDGRHDSGGKQEVWTRVAPITNLPPSSQPPSRPPSPPDLGLPYEVQHYILAMMQRILEEGCYEFASRWVPGMLNDRNWTCSEAVELTAWKKFLPTAVPYSAISHVMGYSLEAGLVDAVKIRNAAVHRHLCDNREIRFMTLKAQDLMSMFSDLSRKEKFARLQTELSRWDKGSRENRDVARAMLEEALREIGERPMDDMDWTPNAVSLQEIKIDAEARQEIEEHFVDEMELD